MIIKILVTVLVIAGGAPFTLGTVAGLLIMWFAL